MKQDLEQQKQTVDGGGTLRIDLTCVKISDSEWWIVHQPTETVLCQSWNNYGWLLTEPLRWKSAVTANKWIESGCIGELQESLTNLAVGFQNQLINARYKGYL